MKIERLRLQHLRCFQQAEIAPGPSLNWLLGPNGAGKTTLLESIYLLSHGRSFRNGPMESLIQRGEAAFTLYAEISSRTGLNSIGVSRNAESWQLRLNGKELRSLAPVLECCAAICFEPDGGALISGAAEVRRRFLDWGTFHVEHGFLEQWRRYRRALRQRNVLLRTGGEYDQFSIWEAELEKAAVPIEDYRRAYLAQVEPHVASISGMLLPELGRSRLLYQSGRDSEKPLSAVLAEQREKDRRFGHTRAGPHRADWRMTFENAPVREQLSRGQTKLAVLACVLAQAELFSTHTGEWPILCLDDLTSELDARHLQQVLEYVLSRPAQIWITSVHGGAERIIPDGACVFHVEQAAIRTS